MKTEKIQAIRGMNDILPSDINFWQQVERNLTDTLSRYGYQEIRFPFVESTQLFKRSIGEVTDIVEKEMYTFNDLNGDSLSLRPEGTAGCIRACLEHGLLYNQQQRLWYMGPMFRHEKPQKGRYRQFNQLGVEVLGIQGVGVELELLSLSNRLWNDLEIQNSLQLQINTLGSMDERAIYRKELTEYFRNYFNELDELSKTRLERNPLRILDSKDPKIKPLLEEAPKLIEFIGSNSKEQFETVCNGLEALGIPYVINHLLVRGLDYYEHTIFEWVNEDLGSQSTVCAGGRYDALIPQLGGSPSQAVGFAIGLERLILSLQTAKVPLKKCSNPSIFIIGSVTDEVRLESLQLAEQIREKQPNWNVLTNLGTGSFKSQFKKADKSNADIAIILGDDEIKNQKISLKNLRFNEPQITIQQDKLIEQLESIFIKNKAEAQ